MTHSTSWWRVAPAALIAVAAIAVLPATAGAATAQPSVWNSATLTTSSWWTVRRLHDQRCDRWRLVAFWR